MMNRPLPVVGALLLAAALLMAGTGRGQWHAEDRPAPDVSWRKDAGSFGAMLLLTHHPEAFHQDWYARPANEAPEFWPARDVVRGESLGVMILLSSKSDTVESMQMIAAFEVLRPDGSQYGDALATVLWDGPVPPHHLQLGHGLLVIRPEPGDSLGTWTVRVHVLRRPGDEMVELERTFTLFDPAAGVDLDAFMTWYYLDPRPRLVGPSLLELNRRIPQLNDSARLGTAAFYSLIFAQYPERIAEWRGSVSDPHSLTQDVLDLAVSISGSPGFLFADSTVAWSGNDMLWGAFFASGDSIYVRAIVNNLGDLDERKDLARYMTATSAAWSLAANAQSHPRVRRYLERMKQGTSAPWSERLSDVLTRSPEELQERATEVLKEQHARGIW